MTVRQKETYELAVGIQIGGEDIAPDSTYLDITFRPIEKKGKWSLRNLTNQIGRAYNDRRAEIKEDPDLKGSVIFIELYPRMFEYEDLTWKDLMAQVERGAAPQGEHVETGNREMLWNNVEGFTDTLKQARKYIINDPKAQKALTAFYTAFSRSFGEDGIPRRRKKK